MRKVKINGHVMEISNEIETIAELMKDLELKSPVIIVEHNEVVLKKQDLNKAKVASEDKIEFVQFVGGG